MPLVLNRVGFEMERHERIAELVAAVGGPTKAAALLKRSRPHIDNIRKPGADLKLDDLLPLCEAAGVSLDWAATGYQVRPDLQSSVGANFSERAAGFVQLAPLRADPPDFAVSESWLSGHGYSATTLRQARVDDGGMAPMIPKGSLVIVETKPAKVRSGVYVIEIGEELLARRLQLLPGDAGELVADGDPRWRFSVSWAGTGDSRDLGKLGLHRVVWAGQDV